MAHVQIRHYVDDDEMYVKDIFTLGMREHIPYFYLCLLKQRRTQMLLACGFCFLLVSSKSLLLPILAVFLLLTACLLLIFYMFSSYIQNSMHRDFSNIRQTYLEQHNSCFWVAESQGHVVGMVACLPAKQDDGCLELRRISVKHSHRGQGIAKALCRTVADFARKQGCPALVLYTSSVQTDAQRLYESVGYKKVREFAAPEVLSSITKFTVVKYMLDLQQPRRKDKYGTRLEI